MTDDELRERVLSWPPGEGDPAALLVAADRFLERGDAELAASALDAAYGLAPRDPDVVRLRASVLDALAVEAHGLRFRYVPAGTFRMGSDAGDPDERPVHRVRLAAYWLTDACLSRAEVARLAGWAPLPDDPGGTPHPAGASHTYWEEEKIRRAYDRGPDEDEDDERLDLGVYVGPPAHRPMVAVSWQVAEELGASLSDDAFVYRLPTEAEWEKGARGGLVGARWAWGDEPPDERRCDLDRFGRWYLAPSRARPPNGYGLFDVCGGVSEWTADVYDALAYRGAPRPKAGPRVLRGGSWADVAEACTVSFRASRDAWHWREDGWGDHMSPTIGFRLARARR